MIPRFVTVIVYYVVKYIKVKVFFFPFMLQFWTVGSSPIGAPGGAASAPKSEGYHIGKRWFGLEAIVGVVLICSFIWAF